MPEALGNNETVLVIDFGAQYAQLIARRVRQAHVYSEIIPSSMPVAEILAKKPKAIILSGGPSSVYAPGAPTLDPAIFEHGNCVQNLTDFHFLLECNGWALMYR